MIQQEPGRKNGDGHVVLFLTTHESREGDLLQAIQQLEESSAILGSIVRMRVQS
jgi:hypothetical protein